MWRQQHRGPGHGSSGEGQHRPAAWESSVIACKKAWHGVSPEDFDALLHAIKVKQSHLWQVNPFIACNPGFG
jgi:hypothetical protein